MSRYIDIDKVIEDMNEVLINEKHNGNEDTVAYFAFKRIIQALRNEPTADVEEVRHGKWIFFRGYITCSSCKAQPYREHRHIDFDNLYKRCPECGAHMNKEKQECQKH